MHCAGLLLWSRYFEYVTSSLSHPTSEGQKYGKTRSVKGSWNWLQLVHCAYLQSHPGYFRRRLQIVFLEGSGMEEVYRKGSEY